MSQASDLRMNKGNTALEVAASLGFEDLFGLVREAGADESAWISASDQASFDDTKPSFLSITSPVHEAIEHGQHAMLERLLYRYYYSPNYRAMVAPTVALPPLSFALGRCDPNDPNVRACIKHLLAHPDIDLNIRTPIFKIHPLHLAVACHDPELLNFLPMPLSSAGTTALGHTLLHIASLPLTSMSMNREIPDAVRSVHCARTLDSKWLPHSEPSPLHLETTKQVGIGVPFCSINPPTPLTPAQQDAQLSTLRVLAEARINVRLQDVDGNTALHYLATALNGDSRAMQLVREMEGGEEIYNNCKNREGLTPLALWEACNEM
jgi:ankyrin repeat protein